MADIARRASNDIDRFRKVQWTLHGQSLDLNVSTFRLDLCNIDCYRRELISEDLIDGHGDRSHGIRTENYRKSPSENLYLPELRVFSKLATTI